MMTSDLPIPPRSAANLAALANHELAEEEWRAQLAIPLSPEEVENTLMLARWFRRRYPTVASRLAYVRRAYARWHHNTASPPSGR